MSRYGRDAAIAMGRGEQNSGSWRNPTVRRVMLTSLLVGIWLLSFASVVVNTARAEPLPNGVPGSWVLLFNEEFSANGLNTALWTPEWPSGPMSGQCTSPSLVSQPGNGYLYLQVRAQESTCGGANHADTGALVESNPADGKPGHSGFLYSYGYVEWHAYIVGWGGEAQGCPKGGCIPDWPALWSFPENEENEIDTMEGLHGTACHTWHHHISPVEETQGCQSGSYAGWHTYGVDWEPGVLTFYYDGAKVGEVNTGYINSTPQYLIMNDVPPGSYGGKLVVPDEIVVDYVRVWQHPTPPTVITGGRSGLQPLQATLEGTVNPNGVDSHYYFQYGTSPSYGSTTGEVDAGSGTSAVPASATVGLSPGTTYHYRLVARNSAGLIAYGGDEAFTTPGPVEAVTTGASDVYQTQAQLNGTVDPRGYDAKYFFQYGETSAYGMATPEGDAGSGSSAVPESAMVTAVEPDTTYHYRLVATSGGITSYGSDQVFTTASPLVGFQASSDELYTYVGSPYKVVNTTEGMMPGTSPSIAAMPGGGYEVAFQASSGELYTYSTSPYKVVNTTEGMMPGTSPSIVATPGGGFEVAFQASSGELYTYSPSPYKVSNTTEGMKAGTSPSIAVAPSGEIEIAFQSGAGELYTYVASPYKVVDTTEGMRSGTSPSIATTLGGGFEVAFQASSGELYTYSPSPYKVSNTTEGMKAGTSPSIAVAPSGEIEIAFQSGSGELYTYVASPYKVSNTTEGMMVGTSPNIAVTPGGRYEIAFQAGSGELYTYIASPYKVVNTTEGMKAGTSPSICIPK